MTRAVRHVASCVALVIALAGCATAAEPATAMPPVPPERGPVIKVVDGDTVDVWLVDHIERVRPLGIDAPESVHPTEPIGCWGLESAAWARAELAIGEIVTLRRDTTQGDRDSTPSRRLLRYITGSDGRDFSISAAGEGAARSHVHRGRPVTLHPLIVTAETRARDANLGLWRACNPE